MSHEVARGRGFALATRDDDADIRALLRNSVMPGTVHVAFTREPDYFAGEGLAGAIDHTLIHRSTTATAPSERPAATEAYGETHGEMHSEAYRDRPTQYAGLDAVGRLSVHTLHRNGGPETLGYLGELRLAPDASHGARMLRDGYHLLRSHAQAAQVAACFTSIASDNTRARRVLERGRRFGLPGYTPLAELVTLLVPVRGADADVYRDATRGSAETREELSDFLNDAGREGHLTLTWDDRRWSALATHGVTPNDFLIVREHGPHGAIVAAGTVWDQRAFRQTLVVHYDGVLRWSRPAVNLLSVLGLAPPLPAPGHVLAQGAILAATAHRRDHWRALLAAMRHDAARRGLDWLLITRDRRDPELDTLRALARTREYHSRLYDVAWPDTPDRRLPWDDRLFRPEVALL